MKNRSLAFVALTAFVAACGGSEPTGPTVTSVTVTPGSSTLSTAGATVQLQAVAKDASGGTVSGEPVSWSASDASVASVSGSGLATAVAPGTTAITATIAGVAGSAVITVEQGIVECAAPTSVALAAGEQASFDGGDCLMIPSGNNGDRYRVIVLRPSESEQATDVVTSTLNVLGMGVSGAPPPPTPAAPSSLAGPIFASPALLRAAEIADATSRVHMEMRRKEAELWREIGSEKLLPSRVSTGAMRASAAPSPAKIQLDVTTGSDCSTTPSATRTAILVLENDDMAIYQDSTQRATMPVTAGQANRMLNYYTSYSRDMLVEYFGRPSDIDGNERLVVFVSPAASGTTAAFVWSGDFLPEATCAASNEMEVIYFNNDLVQSMDDEDATFQALETLAHEAKHVVSLYNRLAATNSTGVTQFHPSWIEEGTAEISGEMSSRIGWASNGGPAVGTRVTRENFVSSGGFTAENYGVVIRLARVVWYLSSQPNGIPVSPNGADESNSIYGSGWLFHRWLGDTYGDAASSAMADAPFFRALNDSTAPKGTTGLFQETGTSFNDLLEEFAVAIGFHETGQTADRPFATYDFLTATTIFSNPDPLGDFPWPVTTTAGESPSRGFNTAQYTGNIGPSGMRIHDFVSNGSGTGAQISLNMASVGRLLVVRIR